jgi:hypothetical protein
MKKSVKGYIAGFLTASLIFSGTLAFAETMRTVDVLYDSIKLVVDGKSIDTSPVLLDSLTYVPTRAIVEAMGAKVEWVAETQTVIVTSAEKPQPSSTAPISNVPSKTDTQPEETEVEDTSPVRVVEEPPFRVGEIDYDLQIETTHISSSYNSDIYTYIRNNTGYTLTSFRIEWYDTEERETHYLSMDEEELLDGEVSDNFEGVGPESGSMDDVEIREIRVGYLDENGGECSLYYNAITREYTLYNF